MGSIVIELQKDALDKSTSIADLLRKALVVARKLKLVEFEDWVQGELDGYQNGGDIGFKAIGLNEEAVIFGF